MTGKELKPLDREKLARDRARVESGFWDKLRHYARRIPFLEEVVAAYYCALDKQTPLQAKAVLFGALAYLVLPIDVIPDFLAWLGFADDATVLFAAIRTVKPHIKKSHRDQARAALDSLLGEGAGGGRR
jgi:uncharacterized membrane protein YkvA (DUF1232 family)